MLRDLFFDYTPDLLGELHFRFGVNLLPESKAEIEFDGIKKICVFATSGIGNLILLIPTLRGLRESIPDAKITLIVASEEAAAIIEGCHLVDEIVVHNNYTNCPKRELYRKLRAEWYDLAIAATHRGYMRAKETFRTEARFRIGFRYSYRQRSNVGFFLTHPVQFEANKHEIEQNLQLLQPLGITANPEPCLKLPDEDLKFAADFLSAFGLKAGRLLVGFHTGSASELYYRCWQPEKFAQLGDKLVDEYGAQILIVGGKAEEKYVAGMIQLMSHQPISAVAKTTLRQTAALIKRCQLFISNDSGPMHIAAAQKVPTIGIFGPTDHIAHAPYGENCHVIRSSLPCSPCHPPHSDGYGCGEVDCFRFISVSEVFEIAKRVLSNFQKEVVGR